MPATSTLRTPITPALTLSRTITPHAVTVEIHDDTGAALYVEEIALRLAAPGSAEPSNPEQTEPIL